MFDCSRRFVPLLLAGALLLTPACGENVLQGNARKGTCPVCRMQVRADDRWTAEIHYNDGTKLMFESAADMLRFYSEPFKYRGTEYQKDQANIRSMLMKDYQSRNSIDARVAALVYKSRVRGPMGPDLLPFESEETARQFTETNGGEVVRLEAVTAEMLGRLKTD